MDGRTVAQATRAHVGHWQDTINEREAKMTFARIQQLMHRKLLDFGWRVERNRAPAGRRAGRAYWDAPYLQLLNFSPRTIIDAGVADGTPSLYAAFPTADLVLIEPLEEFFSGIQRLLATRRGFHFPVAVADENSEREIVVVSPLMECSSLFERQLPVNQEVRISKRRVPARTLDTLLASHSFPDPFGLKIDTEGAELAVIRGAKDTLTKCEFVIAEVSVSERFRGGYVFAEFVDAMWQEHFQVCDILDIGRASNAQVTFLDLVFRRRSNI
jgi:FkbM family methyltransferase